MRALISFLFITVLSIGPIAAQTNQPDEESMVYKEYDENGNLIQYDSTFVQSWSSDSTFTFPLDGPMSFGEGFPYVYQFLQEFFGDSTQFGNSLPESFFHTPLPDDEFFKQFGESFPDSLFMGIRPFFSDSILNHRFGFSNQFPPGFGFRDWQDFQHLFQKPAQPKFQTPEQQEEWERLLERHQKEKNDFLKKTE